jgi:uncharacterized C2H2 Zn-finger protein
MKCPGCGWMDACYCPPPKSEADLLRDSNRALVEAAEAERARCRRAEDAAIRARNARAVVAQQRDAWRLVAVGLRRGDAALVAREVAALRELGVEERDLVGVIGAPCPKCGAPFREVPGWARLHGEWTHCWADGPSGDIRYPSALVPDHEDETHTQE